MFTHQNHVCVSPSKAVHVVFPFFLYWSITFIICVVEWRWLLLLVYSVCLQQQLLLNEVNNTKALLFPFLALYFHLPPSLLQFLHILLLFLLFVHAFDGRKRRPPHWTIQSSSVDQSVSKLCGKNQASFFDVLKSLTRCVYVVMFVSLMWHKF